jgi:chromosome segregation ATPase
MNEVVVARQEAKSGELVEKSVCDLLGMLDQIENSLKTTEELTDRAKSVEQKGHFKAFVSGISGKSDKELASIIKGLGANVKVTQEVVKFLIELAQHKSVVQEGFLGALDKKIADQQNKLLLLDRNDGSLDENAKHVETAVLTLYKQVHAQVESEVELRRNVDRNMENIGALYEALDSKGQTDAEQSEQISQLIQAMREKTFKLEELRLSLEAKENNLNNLAQQVDNQSKKLFTLEHGLELKALKLEKSIGDIQENTSADKLREKRIFKLEAELETLAQRKMPQAPAYIAIVLAVVAIGSCIYSNLV